MNIFYLSEDVTICAMEHCDKHVVKMILETAQLLCSAHWVTGGEAPYKLTHANHPCSIWARENISNYKWLCKLGIELCAEYRLRYKKVHKTQAILDWCWKNIPDLPTGKFSKPPQCMPEDCKCDNTVEAYRNYYRKYKRSFAKWNKSGNTPKWMNE